MAKDPLRTVSAGSGVVPRAGGWGRVQFLWNGLVGIGHVFARRDTRARPSGGWSEPVATSPSSPPRSCERPGFPLEPAACFVPQKKVDHWVVEYWSTEDRRWIRIDPEILDRDNPARADDLRPGEFVTGGETWQLVRPGQDDAADFGVAGTENWGPGEIRGNAIRDLAALHKVEMLPWDEWGPIEDSYSGKTDAEFDRLIDQLATACSCEDDTELQRLYGQLAVPIALIG